MVFLVIFLAGMAAGAGVAYHFAGVALMKQRLAELEREASHTPADAE